MTIRGEGKLCYRRGGRLLLGLGIEFLGGSLWEPMYWVVGEAKGIGGISWTDGNGGGSNLESDDGCRR